jgi:hypothetical protein
MTEIKKHKEPVTEFVCEECGRIFEEEYKLHYKGTDCIHDLEENSGIGTPTEGGQRIHFECLKCGKAFAVKPESCGPIKEVVIERGVYNPEYDDNSLRDMAISILDGAVTVGAGAYKFEHQSFTKLLLMLMIDQYEFSDPEMFAIISDPHATSAHMINGEPQFTGPTLFVQVRHMDRLNELLKEERRKRLLAELDDLDVAGR